MRPAVRNRRLVAFGGFLAPSVRPRVVAVAAALSFGTAGLSVVTSTTRSSSAPILDCGSHNSAVNAPITRAPNPTLTDCIGDAFAAGTPARFVLSKDSGSGGPVRFVVVTTFEVIGPRRVRVTTDPTRAGAGNTIIVSECTELSAAGTIVEVAGCKVVTTRPVTASATRTVLTRSSATTVTVAVTTKAGRPVAAGDVVLTVDGKLPMTVQSQTAGAGRWRFTVTLAVGRHTLRAHYTGADDYRPSSSATVTITVRAR